MQRPAVEADPPAVAVSLPLHQMLDEDGQVLETIPQRRHLHGKDVQAIEQILAEPAAADGGLEVAMGGRR